LADRLKAGLQALAATCAPEEYAFKDPQIYQIIRILRFVVEKSCAAGDRLEALSYIRLPDSDEGGFEGFDLEVEEQGGNAFRNLHLRLDAYPFRIFQDLEGAAFDFGGREF